MNFAQYQGNRMRQPVFWPFELDETANDEMDNCFNHQEKKRRLSVDQVQFLEKCFELQNKLEPDRKVQLAKELCLQPRQVAIWFQNRRARWKTRQLEKDYEVLKQSYSNLRFDYENLRKEKEELQAKVHSLTNMMEQKEKDYGNLELFQLLKLDPDIDGDRKKLKEPTNVSKNENISSATSIVLDSEIPRHDIDGGYSPAAFEQAQSDRSQAGDLDEVKGSAFLLNKDNNCHYEIQVGDQPLWSFWS